jgi:CoA:oxalate CoA-transferase
MTSDQRPATTRPLSGLKLLDFTWALAGPYGTMILADMGAEVWKIEPVGMTEAERGPGPMVHGANLYFHSINRGKLSLQVDLKHPEGVELCLRLAERADIVAENFSPGTMARLGLGYADVSARNPRIIYAHTSGFGQTGPDANRGAVDIIVQAASGLMSITGHPDGPPARAGYSIGDMAGGMFTAIGILGAVIERERSGLGQELDVAMLDAQIALLENPIARYFATGVMPQRIGTRHPLITPFQAFPTADGYIVVAGVKDWTLFCALIDEDALAQDARFADNALRTQNHAQLEPLLNAAFQRRTTAVWIEVLSQACLVGPLHTIADVTAYEQPLSRNAFAEIAAPDGTQLKVSNSPLKYSRTPVDVDAGADPPGGHTESILRDVLGLGDDELVRLTDAGVIGTPKSHVKSAGDDKPRRPF